MSTRVHVVGAGPVGLLLTALLQSTEGCSVHLSEKRQEYTRTRMVQLAPYLVADSVESYRTDAIDGDSVEAIFDPPELEEGLAYRQSIAPDLAELLQAWAQGFCPLNSIERSLSELIDARGHSVERTAAAITVADAISMLEPGDVLIDSTGSRSLLRDLLIPADIRRALRWARHHHSRCLVFDRPRREQRNDDHSPRHDRRLADRGALVPGVASRTNHRGRGALSRAAPEVTRVSFCRSPARRAG